MTDTRRARPRVGWRLLAVSAGTVLALSLSVGPAAAHNALRSTSPTDAETVATAPASVSLTFNEPAVAMGTQVVVRGPSGDVQLGPPRLVDNTVTQDLEPGAPAGSYAVTWRVTSADGHPVTGSYAFTARAAAPGQPPARSQTTPPAETAPPGRVLAGPTLPIGALLVIAVAVLGIRRARRTPGPRRPPPVE